MCVIKDPRSSVWLYYFHWTMKPFIRWRCQSCFQRLVSSVCSLPFPSRASAVCAGQTEGLVLALALHLAQMSVMMVMRPGFKKKKKKKWGCQWFRFGPASVTLYSAVTLHYKRNKITLFTFVFLAIALYSVVIRQYCVGSPDLKRRSERLPAAEEWPINILWSTLVSTNKEGNVLF